MILDAAARIFHNTTAQALPMIGIILVDFKPTMSFFVVSMHCLWGLLCKPPKSDLVLMEKRTKMAAENVYLPGAVDVSIQNIFHKFLGTGKFVFVVVNQEVK